MSEKESAAMGGDVEKSSVVPRNRESPLRYLVLQIP